MGATFLYNFVRFLLLGLELLIIVRVVLSYIERDPRKRSAISEFVFALTEPILAPIRRLLPQGGGFDFSPLSVILVLGAIVRSLPG